MTPQNGELKALEAEVLYTPAELRQGHLARLERLIPEILPDQLYTYQHIFNRITQFKPDNGGEKLLSGRDILRELGRLLTTASASAPLEAAENVLSLFDVARRCRVAPKTVKRWALDGLPLADWSGPEGRLGPGVRSAALQQFLDRRQQHHAKRGRRLEAAETEAIGARADILAAQSEPPGEMIRRLAAESGYSCSTVRRVLNRRRREAAPTRLPGGLDSERSEELIALYRKDVPVADLATKFNRSKATIYRLLHRALIDKILTTTINYIPNPAFARPDADKVCLGEEGLFAYPPEESPDKAKTPPNRSSGSWCAATCGWSSASRNATPDRWRRCSTW